MAGEVRQGSEAKGNAGRVEVRQAAKGAIRKGGTGGARTGKAGAERTECKGEEGESRQARNDVFRMERKGRDWKRMAGVE